VDFRGIENYEGERNKVFKTVLCLRIASREEKGCHPLAAFTGAAVAAVCGGFWRRGWRGGTPVKYIVNFTE